MRRTRRKGYGKAGDYVEIRVPYKSTYCQVAQAAAEAVDLEPELSSDDSDHDHEEAQKPALVLLRAQGCIVQNKPLVTEPDTNEQVEWTIGSYLSTFPSFRRSRQAIKLGVGRGLTEQMEQSHKQHHDGSGEYMFYYFIVFCVGGSKAKSVLYFPCSYGVKSTI